MDAPEWLGRLTALTMLDLSDNQLTALPESLGNLSVLTSLNMSKNELAAVPESLGRLTALTMLDLSDNQLTALPESLGNLSALTSLNISRNHSAAVPDSVKSRIVIGSEDNPLLGDKSEAVEAPPKAAIEVSRSEGEGAWRGEWLDRTWMRIRSLFVPSVSLAAILMAADTKDSAAAVLQLYAWERDRLLTLAKGAAGAAVTVLIGIIATATEGKSNGNAAALWLSSILVVILLLWGGFLLIGIRRLSEEYTAALSLMEQI